MDQHVLPSPKGAPCHVLRVDDDPVHRILDEELLHRPKFAVSQARSGQPALALLRTRSFSRGLLDKRRPGMDGARERQTSL